jgi:hypothetical protein
MAEREVVVQANLSEPGTSAGQPTGRIVDAFGQVLREQGLTEEALAASLSQTDKALPATAERLATDAPDDGAEGGELEPSRADGGESESRRRHMDRGAQEALARAAILEKRNNELEAIAAEHEQVRALLRNPQIAQAVREALERNTNPSPKLPDASQIEGMSDAEKLALSVELARQGTKADLTAVLDPLSKQLEQVLHRTEELESDRQAEKLARTYKDFDRYAPKIAQVLDREITDFELAEMAYKAAKFDETHGQMTAERRALAQQRRTPTTERPSSPTGSAVSRADYSGPGRFSRAFQDVMAELQRNGQANGIRL